VNGEIVATNTALKDQPGLLNSDPYGEGWFTKIRPADWEAESGDLVTGDEGIAAYRAFLDAEGISCEE
jgi:glycine cleavage system H protein